MIVLDCSVAIEMALGTEDGQAFMALALPEERTIAPSFLKIEAANVAWKHVRTGYIGGNQARGLFADAVALVDMFYPEEDLLAEALSESVRLEHSVYDMLYFVLARRQGATLFTCDKRLQELCAANGVDCVEIVSI